MTFSIRQALAIALACLVAATAGCGGSDEPEGEGLPAATVSELERRLDEIERRYREAVDNGNVGACDDIQNDSLPAVDTLVGSLPDDVDPDVRQTVEDGFARLEELARAECSSVEPAETETETEPAPTPTETETTPEQTTPEETETETAPEETTPEQPQEEGGDNGGGAAPELPDPSQPGQGGGAEAEDG